MENGAYFILFLPLIIGGNAEIETCIGVCKIYLKEEIGGKNVAFCMNLLYVIFT